MTIQRPLEEIALHFATPVWGSEYTRTFLEVMLPSLLAPGNLPAIPNRGRSVYRIFTLDDDVQAIKESAAYAALASLMAVEVSVISVPDENKYHRASDCYRESFRKASQAQAAIVMLGPDVVVADGSIDAMLRLLNAGKRAILVLGVRTVKESLMPELLSRYAEDGFLRVPKRDLAKLALDHLHPITESHMFDGDSPNYHASGLFWRVGDEGLLLHGFHLHPIAVHAPTFSGEFQNTIDNDMVEKANLPDDEVHVVTDSDEILCFEMSSRDYSFATPERGGMRGLVTSVLSATTKFHWKIVQVPIRVHAGKTTASDWKRTEQRAQYVIKRILDSCEESIRLAAWARGDFRDASIVDRLHMMIRAISDASIDVRNFIDSQPRVRAKAFLAFLIIAVFRAWSVVGLPTPAWLKSINDRAEMYLQVKKFFAQTYNWYVLRIVAATFAVTAQHISASLGISTQDPGRRP